MTNITAAQAKAATSILFAVAETIRELGSVPSGHLYARLMDRMTHSAYQEMIDVLTRAGVVEVKNFMVTWKGPK